MRSNQSYLRTPRAIVMINNVQVLWADITINTNQFYVADTYQIELPLNGQNKDINLNFWASSPQFTLSIYIGFPSNPDLYTTSDLDLFMVGDANEIEIDPLNARVFIYGRDLSSKFIDTKSTVKYSNQTSSQIALQLANEQGLTPVVTNTTTPVGVFLQSQQTLLTYQYTQWDLLSYLAQQENFVCFVQNNNLVFEPRPTSNNNQTNTNAYVLIYQPPTIDSASPMFNGETLSFNRAMNLSGDVSVTVRVPYSYNNQSFYKRAGSTHRQRSNLPSSVPKRYTFVYPGLTPQQAENKANQLLNDITMHEVRINASLPGDNILKKDSVIQVKGTNSSFDQIYYPDQITRTLNLDGYRMEVSAKNTSIDQEAAA